MTDVARNTGRAIFYASLAAGPIAIATLGIAQLLAGAPLAVDASPGAVGGILGGGVTFSVIATVFALLPNIVGVTVMSWLASRNVGLRHPAVWALAGAAMSGVPAWLSVTNDPGNAYTGGWAAIGAMSALIGRWAVRWEEPRLDVGDRRLASRVAPR